MKYSIINTLVIGLGLIGGSLAKSLKQNRAFGNIIGYDRDPKECQMGLELGVIDEAASSLADAAEKADLIVLAVPVKAMETVLADIAPFIAETTLLTDVGSTKANVVDAAKRVFGELPEGFVPGHPIAGSEKVVLLRLTLNFFSSTKLF